MSDAFQGLNDGFGKQMNQMILEQQIDSVFTALITIIETEQIKLKALLCRNASESAPIGYHAAMPKTEHRNDRHEEDGNDCRAPKRGGVIRVWPIWSQKDRSQKRSPGVWDSHIANWHWP